jgi:propanol-preferring alcohol dehydrogenase
MPGTFQQYVTSDANYVTPIPDNLDSAEAAPLLCGGVTVFVALKKANLLPGQWVALSGAGGGLGHLAIQYAKSFGLQVLAIDHGSKQDFCLKLGADAFIDFTKFDDEGLTSEAKSITGGGAHAVLVNNASTKVYDQALTLVRYGGTLVCVGIPDGEAHPIAKALPWYLIVNKLTIVGTVTGSRKDAIDCLAPAARGLVRTQLRIEPMGKLTQVAIIRCPPRYESQLIFIRSLMKWPLAKFKEELSSIFRG